MYCAVLKYLFRCFQNLKDTLLGQCRSKDDWEVNERSHTLTNSILKGINNLLVLVFNQIPLVHNHNKTLIVTLYELEDIHILRLDTTCCIQHKNTNVRVLNTSDRTHNAIELQVFTHLVLTTNTSCINKIKIKAKLRIASIDTIAGCTCNLGNNITILANEGIDNT